MERWEQPGLCVCNDGVGPWHAHYPEEPHRCAAGCGCQGWRPTVRPVVDAVRWVRNAEAELDTAERTLAAAWTTLGKVANAPTGNDADNDFAMATAQALIAEHTIAEHERARSLVERVAEPARRLDPLGPGPGQDG